MHKTQTHRLSATVLFLASMPALLGLPGCEILRSIEAGAQKPTARITGVHFQGLSLDSVSLVFDAEVRNPYAVQLPVPNVEFNLKTKGEPFLSGKAEIQGMIPAASAKVLPLPVSVRFVEVMRVLSEVRPGSVVPYDALLTLSVNAPAIGPLSLPITKSGELPIPTAPGIDVAAVRWGTLSLEKAEAILDVTIRNHNTFPVDLAGLSYSLGFGTEKVAEGDVQSRTSFGAGGENTVSIPVAFSPRSLGLAFFSMLLGKEASYRLAGKMSLGTPYGSLDLPYERSGTTPLKK